MTKVSGKAAKKSARKKTLKRKPGKAPDFEKVREKINTLVGGQAVDLVQSAMVEAEKGHFTAMKYLFEMIGLYPATGEDLTVGDDSLAKTLLERMGLPEELAVEHPEIGELAPRRAGVE